MRKGEKGGQRDTTVILNTRCRLRENRENSTVYPRISNSILLKALELQLQAGLDGRKKSSTLQTQSSQNLLGDFAHEVKEFFVDIVRRQAIVHHFAVHAHLIK